MHIESSGVVVGVVSGVDKQDCLNHFLICKKTNQYHSSTKHSQVSNTSVCIEIELILSRFKRFCDVAMCASSAHNITL